MEACHDLGGHIAHLKINLQTSLARSACAEFSPLPIGPAVQLGKHLCTQISFLGITIDTPTMGKQHSA